MNRWFALSDALTRLHRAEPSNTEQTFFSAENWPEVCEPWQSPVSMAAAKSKPKVTKSPASPGTPAPLSREEGATTDDRRSDARRDLDRRAFWRPTPDRRREASELGRRTSDATD